MIEMINPATAKPLGALNRPMNDRRKPRNQTTQPTPGIHERIREMSARTNPAVPAPFDERAGGCWMTIVWQRSACGGS